VSIQYLRKTYGVPAKRGGKIEYTDTQGKTSLGAITGARGPYLRVRMWGGVVALHPTWNVKYLSENQ